MQSFLREKGIGFAVGPVRVPIVPQAILFDLLNGGDKNWGLHSPYRNMAYEAGQRSGAVENCLNQSLSRAAHGRLDALL